jgi:triacylglycerol lipase
MYSALNPVLLIHGIDDTATKFRILKPYLEELGWVVHAISLSPNNGDVGLEHLAQQVANYAATTFVNQPFDLVGFSMGGIVSRYYVQRLGGIHQVQRFITISSPHYGTQIANFRFNQGASQMRRSSAFLNDLNRDVAMLNRIQFTSIWTPFDLMIVPAESSCLPVGKTMQLPVLLHPWMVRDVRSLEAIATVLRQPLAVGSNS